MGLRFRRSIKIAPGVRLNLNRRSTSITFGRRGAHYTISSTGRRTASIGIPGTGLSYSTSSQKRKNTSAGTYDNFHIGKFLLCAFMPLMFFMILFIFLSGTSKPTNKTLSDMETLQIANHPKFYGDFEMAKNIWSPYSNVSVVNARQTIYNQDSLLLITTGDSDKNYITSIVIDFRNSTEHTNYSFDNMLSLVCSYIPFDIIDKYYSFNNSFKEVTSDGVMDSYYYIYELNHDGMDYNAQNNTPHLDSKFAFNIRHYLTDNSWAVEINYLSSKGNTDKFAAGYFSREDWNIDLNSYR